MFHCLDGSNEVCISEVSNMSRVTRMNESCGMFHCVDGSNEVCMSVV